MKKVKVTHIVYDLTGEQYTENIVLPTEMEVEISDSEASGCENEIIDTVINRISDKTGYLVIGCKCKFNL